jgi:hypothetical protein
LEWPPRTRGQVFLGGQGRTLGCGEPAPGSRGGGQLLSRWEKNRELGGGSLVLAQVQWSLSLIGISEFRVLPISRVWVV